MNTWVRIVDSTILQVIQGAYIPDGEGWVQYPYSCDLAGPRNIAGRNISEFDAQGNFLPVEEPAPIEEPIQEA